MPQGAPGEVLFARRRFFRRGRGFFRGHRGQRELLGGCLGILCLAFFGRGQFHAAEFLRVISRQIRSDYWSFSMEPDLIQLRNLTLCAELIVRSARRRKESRGLHYNVDHPRMLPVPLHTVLTPPRG